MENLDSALSDILTDLADTTDSWIYIINPSLQPLSVMLQELNTRSTPPATRFLLSEEVAQEVQNEFRLASILAELLETDHHEARLTATRENELLLAETKLWSLITIDSRTGIISSNDDQATLARDVYEYYAGRWEEHEQITLRTPPLNEVQASLRERFGDEMEADFMQMITTPAQKSGQGLDVTTICLLLAARYEELLYEISKWGEDSGVASKATFSRAKNRLSEAGLITTEKVPIDVGRPRLRLQFPDEFEDTSLTEIIQEAESAIE